MKSFTRITILVLLMIFTSAVVFSQNNAKKNTISELELQMMQNYQGTPAVSQGEAQDLLAVPITSFPYFQDFEGGSIPAEFDAVPGVDADVRISATAAQNGSWGILFEGLYPWTAWPATPSSYAVAFSSGYATHFGTVNIDVVPDGSSG